MERGIGEIQEILLDKLHEAKETDPAQAPHYLGLLFDYYARVRLGLVDNPVSCETTASDSPTEAQSPLPLPQPPY